MANACDLPMIIEPTLAQAATDLVGLKAHMPLLKI
jgi:hypothetical protein